MKGILIAAAVVLSGCSSMPITDQDVARALHDVSNAQRRIENRGVHKAHREGWLYNCVVGVRKGCRMMGD